MSTLTDLLVRGSLRSGQITAALRISPQTLMRRARGESERVVRIGRGRATRYGLRREVPGLGRSDVPVFRINEDGKPSHAGQLVVLAGDETAWLPDGVVFEGLPPEVADMRPSGFMGRLFPTQHPDLRLPPRIVDWSDDHTLLALATRGEDLPGNLVIGDESLERWLRHPPTPDTHEDYPSLAAAITAGQPQGSSAGGERPKFGAFVDSRHVLVKFVVGEDALAKRWRDLLCLEGLALETLRASGYAAAHASLFDTPSHRFLEVERFDRTGPRGRRATLSLLAAHGDPSDSWARAGARLHETRCLSARDAKRLALYEAFARWTGNTDRHHHNVALIADASTSLARTPNVTPPGMKLAPAFDTAPMLYAPTADGQMLERTFIPPTPTGDTWDVWERARVLAQSFWQTAAADGRLSRAMRDVARANAKLAS